MSKYTSHPEATCPACMQKGGVEVREIFTAKPIGSFSLAGAQPKLTGRFELEAHCQLCDAVGEVK